MLNYLGERIKETRERLGMSQYDSSKDICTQAYISKLEKGNVFPSADILIKLADRFSMDLSYLLDISNTPRYEYIIDTFTVIRDAISKRDYKTVKEICRGEKNNKLFAEKKHQQFLLWHEGICFYYEDNDFNKSISYINNALELTSENKKAFSEREIEILISKGNIFLENGFIKDALRIYEKAEDYIKSLPTIVNKFVPVRLYYNYSRCLRINGDYGEAILISQKGIRLTEGYGLMYLKGDLYFQKALNYKCLGNNIKSVNYFKLAEMTYIIEKNERSLLLARKYIKTLNSLE